MDYNLSVKKTLYILFAIGLIPTFLIAGVRPNAAAYYDINGKSASVGRIQVKIGQIAAVAYANIEQSMRYAPLDCARQAIAPETPENTSTQESFQPKNPLIGKVKDIKGIASGFSNNWTYAKIFILSDNGNESVFLVNTKTALTNENGITNPPLPKKNQTVEILYAINKKGDYEAVSIRYFPLGYVPQQTADASPASAPADTTDQSENIFTGRVASVTKLFPRPPYWRLGIITVAAENGQNASIDVMPETFITDASGKEIGKGRSVWKLKKGEYVEVKYLPAANSGRDKAVSIRCLDKQNPN